MKQTQLSYPTLAHAHSSTPKPTASFQTTFNGLATAAACFHTLRDGELVLYKRPHSRVWQCRYKLFANEWHRQTTKRTVLADAVRVDGKTGGRWLIAKHGLVEVLRRLHSRQKDIASKPFEEVLGRSQAFVFRSCDGRKPYAFNGLFSRFLRHCELLANSAGQTRTLYSLRHTYATNELIAGTDIHILAKQMGTSVAMLERYYSKLTAMLAAEILA